MIRINIPIPKNCNECTLHNCCGECLVNGTHADYSLESRPSDCPLIDSVGKQDTLCEVNNTKNIEYDPEMPCNKKGCDASTRASCCGCPEQLEYERKKREKET